MLIKNTFAKFYNMFLRFIIITISNNREYILWSPFRYVINTNTLGEVILNKALLISFVLYIFFLLKFNGNFDFLLCIHHTLIHTKTNLISASSFKIIKRHKQ